MTNYLTYLTNYSEYMKKQISINLKVLKLVLAQEERLYEWDVR